MACIFNYLSLIKCASARFSLRIAIVVISIFLIVIFGILVLIIS